MFSITLSRAQWAAVWLIRFSEGTMTRMLPSFAKCSPTRMAVSVLPLPVAEMTVTRGMWVRPRTAALNASRWWSRSWMAGCVMELRAFGRGGSVGRGYPGCGAEHCPGVYVDFAPAK